MSEKSKKISYALRHAPDKFGLDMKEDGSVLLADLCDKLDIPLDDVRNIVDNDNKQRFIISDGRIWATQGHSIPVQVPLKKLDTDSVPPNLYHGTVDKFLDSIKDKGLVSGQREFVHLSRDIETAGQVASRRAGEQHILTIKSHEMIEAGLDVWISDNGVFLAREVPIHFIEF